MVQKQKRPAEKPQPTPPVTGGKKKALVIDDEPYVRNLLRKVLVGEGYEIDEAPNGEVGLIKFLHNPEQYAIVICDLRMPGKSGAEVIRGMKAVDPNQPVIMCADGATRLSDAEKRVIGADAYVDKPAAVGDIRETIRALERRRV